MCGIFGYFNLTSKKIIEPSRKKILDILAPRGPDFQTDMISENQYWAFSRLSIIDPNNISANQPIKNETSTLVFNGEIYNYQKLSSYSSDTIFLKNHLDSNYPQLKPALLKLRGFYSFIYYNQKNKTITLARDILGQKPLYFYWKNKELIASSSIRAIKTIIRDLTIDEDALNEYNLTGCIPSPKTQFNEIRQVMPGEILTFDDQLNLIKNEILNLHDTKPETETPSFLEAVQRRFVSDVQVGILLSSGYDSSVILGAAKELGQKPICFTIKPEFPSSLCADESIHSKSYAQKLGCEFHTIPISKQNLEDNFSKYLDKMELPTVDGLNIFCTTSIIKNYVKVLLTGTGGDEVQNRYAHYAKAKALPSYLNSRFNFLKRSIYRNQHPFLLLKKLSQIQPKKFIHESDLHQYLIPKLIRDADWASMENSVEVRAPFLDQDLWYFSIHGKYEQIRTQTQKFDLRDFKSPKFGFELPYELLFKGDSSRSNALLKMKDEAWIAATKQ